MGGFDVAPTRVWGLQRDYAVETHNLPSGSEIRSEQWQHGVIEFRGGARAVYDFTSAAYQSPIRWQRTKSTTEIYGRKGMCTGIDVAIGNGSGQVQPISVKRRTTTIEEVEVVEAYVVDSDPEIVWEERKKKKETNNKGKKKREKKKRKRTQRKGTKEKKE